jgi:hypothetical protein
MRQQQEQQQQQQQPASVGERTGMRLPGAGATLHDTSAGEPTPTACAPMLSGGSGTGGTEKGSRDSDPAGAAAAAARAQRLAREAVGGYFGDQDPLWFARRFAERAQINADAMQRTALQLAAAFMGRLPPEGCDE